MKKVYVTPRSITKNGHSDLKRLEEAGFEIIFAKPGVQPTEEEQLEILPKCTAYLAGIEPITENVLNVARELKVISRNGVGIENIDLNAARKYGIEVKIAPGANSQGVAELAISLMLSAVRRIPVSYTYMKSGEWKRERGFEVKKKTLGVIGCGNIGKRTIKMALGLDMNVLGYDLHPDTNFSPSDFFRFTSLEELYRKSDIISLHCPPGEEPLINNFAINIMKTGMILINTARSGVVDEEALLIGLDSKKISCYAIDVYDKEPPGLNKIISHKNVICTPHIGGYTTESIDRAMRTAIDNILKIIK